LEGKLCSWQSAGLQREPGQFQLSNSYGTWGGNANHGSENTIYSFNDDVTWIRGKHYLKFGGMYQLSHYNGFGVMHLRFERTFNFAENGRGATPPSPRRAGIVCITHAGWAERRAARYDTVHLAAVALLAGYFRTTGASARS